MPSNTEESRSYSRRDHSRSVRDSTRHHHEESSRHYSSHHDSHKSSRSPPHSSSNYSRKRERSISESHHNHHRSSEKDISSSNVIEKKNTNENKEIKMQVMNSGDEISCSIEENNRIRLLLGLKPLEVAKKVQPSVETTQSIDITQQQKDNELRLRLLQAKTKREKAKQALPSKSLGDILEEEEGDIDIAQWSSNYNDVRQKALQKMEEEEKEKERKEEEETKQKSIDPNFSNYHVDHNIEDLKEGETILVLKDTSILDDNGDLNNDDTVVLENLNMKENEEIKRNNERRQKSKHPVFNVLEDNNFEDVDDDSNLLSQYNDDKKVKGFNLTQNGDISKEAKTEMKEKLDPSSSKNPNSFNLLTFGDSEKQVAQDYYTQEEVTQFKKRVKRRRNIKKVDNEIQVLPDHMETEDDKRNREDKIESESLNTKLQEEQDKRLKSYQQATMKEEERIRKLGRSTVVDDDTDLSLLLSKAAQLSKKPITKPSLASEQELAKKISQLREEDQHNVIKEEDLFENPDSNIITSVGEFSRQMAIQTADHKKALKRAQKMEKKQELEVLERKQNEMKNPSENEDVNMNKENNDIINSQPVLSSSISAVFQHLANTGNIQHKELIYGKQTRDERHNTNDDCGFVIEYRDENGRLLSNKEAYKQQSYAFHGKLQGKGKIEKKANRYKKDIAFN